MRKDFMSSLSLASQLPQNAGVNGTNLTESANALASALAILQQQQAVGGIGQNLDHASLLLQLLGDTAENNNTVDVSSNLLSSVNNNQAKTDETQLPPSGNKHLQRPLPDPVKPSLSGRPLQASTPYAASSDASTPAGQAPSDGYANRTKEPKDKDGLKFWAAGCITCGKKRSIGWRTRRKRSKPLHLQSAGGDGKERHAPVAAAAFVGELESKAAAWETEKEEAVVKLCEG